jgi:hypothetical protein
MLKSTTPPATATALRSQLHAEGFRPGIPAGLDPEDLAIDLNTYRRQRCPRCGRRLDAAAWTDGRAYRLLCSCQCGYAVEC